MAKVSNTNIYTYDTIIDRRDFLLGTDWNNNRKTKSFKLEDLRFFILQGLDPSNSGFVVNNGYTLVENVLTINAGWQWRLNGALFTNESEVVFTLEYTTEGFVRIDTIYVNSNNEFVIVSGDESETIAIPPTTPVNTLEAFSINVFDNSVNTPTDPMLGSIYQKKQYDGVQIFNTPGQELEIPLNIQGYNTIFVQGEVESISGFSFDYLNENPTIAEFPHEGKLYYIFNQTGSTLKLIHNQPIFDMFFTLKDEVDIDIPNKGVIVLKNVSSGLVDVIRSWTNIEDISGLQNELDLKADITYVDSLITSVFKAAGNWNASSNTFPTSGTGPLNAVMRGDTFIISVAGTPSGFETLDVGDNIYATIDNPGQTASNWAKFERNTQQATEGTIGTAKIATQATIENESTTNDTDIVTAKKFWFGWAKGLTLTSFFNAVRGTILTGLSFVSSRITSSDTILSAFGKLQRQISELQSTRFTSGIGVSINADNKKFDIQATGIIVDPITFVETPINVSLTGIGATHIATQPESYIWINSSGSVVQSLTPPSPLDIDSIIGYWVLVHSNLTNITVINSFPYYAEGLATKLAQLFSFIGFRKFKDTNIVSAGTTGTRISHTGGLVLKAGIGNTTKRPVISLNGATDTTLRMRNRTQGSEGADTQTLDVTNIDVAGVKTELGKNKFGAHKVWKFSSSLIRVQRGQHEYANIDAAKTGIKTDTFVNEGNAERNGIHIGWIIFKKGTSWGTGGTGIEGTDYLFVDEIQSASAGTSAVTLQGAYNNSTQPQFQISDAKGSLDIKSDRESNSSRVLRGYNNANVETWWINADGTSSFLPNLSLLSDATLPLSDTDELLVNQGGTWKKVDKSEIDGEVTPSDLISSDANNGISNGTDNKLFSKNNDLLITNSSVTGSYNLDYTKDAWNLTLTGNTTFTESNLPSSGYSKTIILEVSGNYTLTFPANWTNYITGSYSGTATMNTIVVHYFGSGKYKVNIIQPD